MMKNTMKKISAAITITEAIKRSPLIIVMKILAIDIWNRKMPNDMYFQTDRAKTP